MNSNELRKIIEQVLGEMNIASSSAAPETSVVQQQSSDSSPAVVTIPPQPGKTEENPTGKIVTTKYGHELTPYTIDPGEIIDITTIDLKEQYLVEDAYDKEGYMEWKRHSPSRLGIGHAGARYLTIPQLEFRAAHSAAQDAVFSGVDHDFVEKMNLFAVRTQCEDKDTYLTRPDLGRKLCDEAVQTIKEKCKKNPTVQVYVSDGLSSAAVKANIADVLPAIMQGLQSYNIDFGTPFFVEYGRVGVMDQISEITGATVTCVLIGERPGLITANSMSAYMAYKATVGMPESRRTVLSNIHNAGTPPVEAGAHIAEIIKKMLDAKVSGTELKL